MGLGNALKCQKIMLIFDCLSWSRLLFFEPQLCSDKVKGNIIWKLDGFL